MLLTGVDWRVEAGERWAVVGPNGAGKTTLLAIVAAETHPTEGEVRVLGARLGAVDLRELRRSIGHVDAGMAAAFAARMSTREVVLTGASATIVLRRERLTAGDVARVDELIGLMGCSGIASRRFALLSRGEQQRALVARAMVAAPRLLLLDEPTAGLDLPGREAFLGHLDALVVSHPGLAVVQVSHHLEELARSVTHALLLRGGRVVAAGPAEQTLRDEPLSRCFGVPVRVIRDGGRLLAVTG